MNLEHFAYDYGVEDLDHNEIYRVIQKGVELGRLPEVALHETIPEALARLGLSGSIYIKNAAVLLFVKRKKHWESQLNIMMARFMGLRLVDDIKDNQCFYGNVFRILSEASHYAGRYLVMPEFLDASDPIPNGPPRLPPLAVREAIINALLHRDYSDTSSNSTFAIYNDRIEIGNSGSLPSELNFADLPNNNKSCPANKLIADVFYICGLTEMKGAGIGRMIEVCRAEGFSQPEFEEDPRGFLVTFRFKESLGPIDSTPHSPTRYPNDEFGWN